MPPAPSQVGQPSLLAPCESRTGPAPLWAVARLTHIPSDSVRVGATNLRVGVSTSVESIGTPPPNGHQHVLFQFGFGKSVANESGALLLDYWGTNLVAGQLGPEPQVPLSGAADTDAIDRFTFDRQGRDRVEDQMLALHPNL